MKFEKKTGVEIAIWDLKCYRIQEGSFKIRNGQATVVDNIPEELLNAFGNRYMKSEKFVYHNHPD